LTPSYTPRLPSFDALESLAPDACRSDPSAPCFYWHLKLHALNGGRDKLAQRELTFVGVDTWPIVTPGWRSPVGLYLDDPLKASACRRQTRPRCTRSCRWARGGSSSSARPRARCRLARCTSSTSTTHGTRSFASARRSRSPRNNGAWAFQQVRAFRRELKKHDGIYVYKELHAWKLVSGRGKIADRVVPKGRRHRIFRDALVLITHLPGAQVFNACFGSKQDELAYEWLLNRINRTMKA
jgi:hypothetical protein